VIGSGPPSILIVSQNVPLPARLRTWQQARALARQGWKVRVICPRRAGQCRRETICDIRIDRFGQPVEGASRLGLLVEYLLALATISVHLFVARLRERIDVVQVVNPPIG